MDTERNFVELPDDSDKKADENSNHPREMNATSNETLNDQKNIANNEQSNEDGISNQHTNESNAPLQFRPLNMFNSPPPGFVRCPPPGPPPLMNPNFFPPPNRFWGNAPPGMNMNQNKSMPQSNRWSSPNNFERQRFNRPPPDFGMEPRTNRRINNDEDDDVADSVRDDDDHNSNLKDDDNAGEDLENFDDTPANDINEAEHDQPDQSSSNQNNSAPKRQNPFSQMPRIPANEEGDFILNKSNNEQQARFNAFRPIDDPTANNQQSPAFNRNTNTNPGQQFNNQNFNNQIGQFNQTPPGPQPLFSPQNMNFNLPMRGRGGIRNDSPYFRPRGRGGPPGMNMNRGNFRPNFRGNNNRGNW